MRPQAKQFKHGKSPRVDAPRLQRFGILVETPRADLQVAVVAANFHLCALDHALAMVVNACGEQHHGLPLLFVVVGNLQKRGGFTGGYGRLPEEEFCHGR